MPISDSTYSLIVIPNFFAISVASRCFLSVTVIVFEPTRGILKPAYVLTPYVHITFMVLNRYVLTKAKPIYFYSMIQR